MTVPADIKKQNIPETQQEPDLFVDADRCDIQFVFTNLTSPAWKRLRIILQRRATVFMYNPDKTAAYVGFILTPDNARKISDLYLRIYRWKSVFVKIKGTDAETMEDMQPWAYCWLLAHANPNPDEYCHIRDYDPQLYTGITGWYDYLASEHTWVETRLTLPCRNVDFRPDTKRPDRYREQYARAAHTSGCDKCPLFNIKGFRCTLVNTDPEMIDDKQFLENKNK